MNKRKAIMTRRGYELIEQLRKDADDCAREDRAMLMRDAATEMACLIREVRVEMTKVEALRDTLQTAVEREAESFDGDRGVNGSDLVDWFGGWRAEAKVVLEKAGAL